MVEVENLKSDNDEDAADKDEDDSDDEDDEMKALAEQMEKRRTAQNSRTLLVAVVLDEGFLPVKGMSASSRSQSKRRKKQASRTGERPRTAPMSRGATLAIRLRGSAAASRRDEMNSIAVALEEKPVFTCAIRCSLDTTWKRKYMHAWLRLFLAKPILYYLTVICPNDCKFQM